MRAQVVRAERQMDAQATGAIRIDQPVRAIGN